MQDGAENTGRPFSHVVHTGPTSKITKKELATEKRN